MRNTGNSKPQRPDFRKAPPVRGCKTLDFAKLHLGYFAIKKPRCSIESRQNQKPKTPRQPRFFYLPNTNLTGIKDRLVIRAVLKFQNELATSAFPSLGRFPHVFILIVSSAVGKAAIAGFVSFFYDIAKSIGTTRNRLTFWVASCQYIQPLVAAII